MRAIIQRAKRASVLAYNEAGEVIHEASIDAGLMVLLGVTHGDGPAQIEKVARKIAQLKILRNPDGSDDPAGRVSAIDVGAPVLLVSQFTLYADVKKGTKPSWSRAAGGDVAEPIFNEVVAAVRNHGLLVKTGIFGSQMEVELVNDGPFTLFVEV